MDYSENNDLSLYIHVPFCASKCLYCDFLSFSDKNAYFEDYKKAVINEIKSFTNKQKYKVNTIFIGGGTPSLMSENFICDILECIYNNFHITNNAEITIETNPATVDKKKANCFKKAGINRVSIGLQAWQNHILKIIGRIHTRDQFLECFNIMRNAGFDNINIDIMFSLPKQSENDWEETVENILVLEPEHVSAYSLIIEEKTPFYKLYEENKLDVVSDDIDRNMYEFVKKKLKENGYIHYEISNFAKNGFECRHNIVYWKRKEYAGFGLGAHSFINGKRYSNTINIDEYIKFNYIAETEKIGLRDSYAEFMFLGLRMIEGIERKSFKNEFGIDIDNVYKNEIEKNIKNGLLTDKNGVIKLTNKGIDLSNVVFAEFL